MEALIKRFLQETPLYTLGSIAFLASSLSLELQFLNPNLQFVFTSLIVIPLTIVSYHKFNEIENFNYYFALTCGGIGLLFNPLGLATIFSVLLVFTILYPLLRKDFLYFSAIISHFTDAFSTFILLPEFSEANLVVRRFIQNFGVVEGLLFSKTILIILPLVYSRYRLSETDQKLFVKIVFVLGISMTFRNLLIYF